MAKGGGRGLSRSPWAPVARVFLDTTGTFLGNFEVVWRPTVRSWSNLNNRQIMESQIGTE